MNLVVCPHCKTSRIVTNRVNRHVILVVPCPQCSELVVLFRKQVVALSRKILEQGSKEERSSHLASVIGKFLEAGMLNPDNAEGAAEEFNFSGEKEGPEKELGEDASVFPPITERDVEEFVRVNLERLDDPEYFKKHFG